MHVLSSKNNSYEFVISAAQYADTLLMFECNSQDQRFLLQILNEMPRDPIIVLAEPGHKNKIDYVIDIRADAIIIPRDPLLKNGIDGALVCPNMLRCAIDERKKITSEKLKETSILLAGMIDDDTILNSQKLLPGILNMVHYLESNWYT